MLALILSLGIFFAYVNPTWSGSIARAKLAIAANNEALDAAKQYSTQQNELAQERDAIDPASLTALTTLLPDSVDNVGLILDLNALSARSGLSVANIDVIMSSPGSAASASTGALPAAALNPVGSVDLAFSAVGTFPALQTFLTGVERSARILDVRDLVVKGSDTGVYQYQMIIRLYWLR